MFLARSSSFCLWPLPWPSTNGFGQRCARCFGFLAYDSWFGFAQSPFDLVLSFSGVIALNKYLVIPLGFDPVNWMMDPAFIMHSLIVQAVWLDRQ